MDDFWGGVSTLRNDVLKKQNESVDNTLTDFVSWLDVNQTPSSAMQVQHIYKGRDTPSDAPDTKRPHQTLEELNTLIFGSKQQSTSLFDFDDVKDDKKDVNTPLLFAEFLPASFVKA